MYEGFHILKFNNSSGMFCDHVSGAKTEGKFKTKNKFKTKTFPIMSGQKLCTKII